jgi:hypothetical protein
MDEMPVVRISVSAGVLTHRRNNHTVGQRDIANREGIKEVGHRVVDFRCLLKYECTALDARGSGFESKLTHPLKTAKGGAASFVRISARQAGRVAQPAPQSKI